MTPTELHHFITENFGGIIVDHPWESDPDYTVYRHADNRKWFALHFTATKSQLAKLKLSDEILNTYPDDTRLNIVNLKLDPDFIPDVITAPGFLPAYHMNRRYWVTAILTPATDPAKLQQLINQSYTLTAKNHTPSN